MPFDAVSTDSVTVGSNSATLNGSWSGFFAPSTAQVWFDYGIGGLTNSTARLTPGAGNTNGSYSQAISTSFDQTYLFSAKGFEDPGNLNGGTLSFLSGAQAVVFGVMTVGTPTSSTCPISIASINTNVVESTATVTVEWKLTTDSVYTSSPALASPFSYTITGLATGATYNVRYKVLRTTTNLTTTTLSGSNFTTVGIPTTSTSAPTLITSTTCRFNGLVNAKSPTNSVSYYFEWGVGSGLTFENVTTTLGPTSSTSDVAFTADVVYAVGSNVHYRTVATYSGGTIKGTSVSVNVVGSNNPIMRL